MSLLMLYNSSHLKPYLGILNIGYYYYMPSFVSEKTKVNTYLIRINSLELEEAFQMIANSPSY